MVKANLIEQGAPTPSHTNGVDKWCHTNGVDRNNVYI